MNADLINLLKETNARISLNDKWLIYDEDASMWIVYQRKYGAKKTITLCATTDVDLYIAIDMIRDENV